MPSNRTPNYDLCQWEAEDQVKRTDFNEDNEKIDAALKALSDTDSGQAVTLSKKGNCRLYVTSYTGDGRSNKSSPMKLTFPTRPYLVIVSGMLGSSLIMVQGVGETRLELAGDGYINYLTWSGNSVSWWCNGDNSSIYMLTERGTTYRVIALLNAED